MGGRPYYRRAEGAFVETVWERPTVANLTAVAKDTAVAEPQTFGRQQARRQPELQAVGVVGGRIKRLNTKQSITEALMAAKAKAFEAQAAVAAGGDDDDDDDESGGSTLSAPSTVRVSGKSYRAQVCPPIRPIRVSTADAPGLLLTCAL